MGAGAAIFIWAVILLQLAFPLVLVGAYVAIARPEVERKLFFWLAGVGVVIALRALTQLAAGLVLLRVGAAREHAIIVLAAEMVLAAGVAVPVLAALARGFTRTGDVSVRSGVSRRSDPPHS